MSERRIRVAFGPIRLSSFKMMSSGKLAIWLASAALLVAYRSSNEESAFASREQLQDISPKKTDLIICFISSTVLRLDLVASLSVFVI